MTFFFILLNVCMYVLYILITINLKEDYKITSHARIKIFSLILYFLINYMHEYLDFLIIKLLIKVINLSDKFINYFNNRFFIINYYWLDHDSFLLSQWHTCYFLAALYVLNYSFWVSIYYILRNYKYSSLSYSKFLYNRILLIVSYIFVTFSVIFYIKVSFIYGFSFYYWLVQKNSKRFLFIVIFIFFYLLSSVCIYLLSILFLFKIYIIKLLSLLPILFFLIIILYIDSSIYNYYKYIHRLIVISILFWFTYTNVWLFFLFFNYIIIVFIKTFLIIFKYFLFILSSFIYFIDYNLLSIILLESKSFNLLHIIIFSLFFLFFFSFSILNVIKSFLLNKNINFIFLLFNFFIYIYIIAVLLIFFYYNIFFLFTKNYINFFLIFIINIFFNFILLILISIHTIFYIFKIYILSIKLFYIFLILPVFNLDIFINKKLILYNFMVYVCKNIKNFMQNIRLLYTKNIHFLYIIAGYTEFTISRIYKLIILHLLVYLKTLFCSYFRINEIYYFFLNYALINIYIFKKSILIFFYTKFIKYFKNIYILKFFKIGLLVFFKPTFFFFSKRLSITHLAPVFIIILFILIL